VIVATAVESTGMVVTGILVKAISLDVHERGKKSRPTSPSSSLSSSTLQRSQVAF
jgi:hypothetical protein